METNANLYKHEHSFLEPMSFIPITNSTTNHPLLENLTEGKTSEKVSKRDWLLITIASDINKELPRWNRHSITLVSKLQDSGQALSLCPSVHPCRAGTGTPAPRGGGGHMPSTWQHSSSLPWVPISQSWNPDESPSYVPTWGALQHPFTFQGFWLGL